LLPESCDVLDAIAAALRSAQAEDIRELELSENSDVSQRVVHLDTAAPMHWSAESALTKTSGLTGVMLSPGRILAGDPHVVDTVVLDEGTFKLRRHVLAFSQGNRYLLRDLVSHVVDQIAVGDDVIDLYAGAGLFSMAAAVARRATVTAVEGDRTAAEDLRVNAATLGGAVEAVQQPVEAFVNAHRAAPAVLIADPPRTGLSKAALEGAIRLQARTIVYVSCDIATLARDARRLLDAGYALQHLRGFDLFPNTPHVESVAAFTRM
jgi:tRNA/tmRNA/rRNA uracil-C5-methylase (TrmA/RlmC/RlmD family)